jgi:hypothetical protein
VAASADSVIDGDEIRLTLPARPEHGRIARVMVSRLGVRHGFRPREVEDLRIAVDESVILLLGSPGATGGTLTVRTRLDGPALHVELLASHAEEPDPEALERFTQLVTPLVDGLKVIRDGGTVRFHRARK